MTPHPGTTKRIRTADDWYLGDRLCARGVRTTRSVESLLNGGSLEMEKEDVRRIEYFAALDLAQGILWDAARVTQANYGNAERTPSDYGVLHINTSFDFSLLEERMLATMTMDEAHLTYSPEDRERFLANHSVDSTDMVLHVPQSAGKSVQCTGRVSYREYALHYTRQLGKTMAITEVCKELLREASSQKVLDAIAEDSDVTQKFLDGEIAVVDPATRRVAVCGAGHERDIALMMGLLYGKSPSSQKEFSLNRFGDIDEDFLKAPCTLPRSKEAWQYPTHKPTGVRKQQRAAKKKRRK